MHGSNPNIVLQNIHSWNTQGQIVEMQFERSKILIMDLRNEIIGNL